MHRAITYGMGKLFRTGFQGLRRRRSRRRCRQNHPSPAQLVVEPLEPRRLLATFTVMTTADTLGGPLLSLRDAVIAANASAGDDTIELNTAGPYVLTRSGAGEDASLDGDLDVTEFGAITTIQGLGGGSTVIDATGLGDRVFHVRVLAGLALEGVTVTGGTADVNAEVGGGIYGEPVATLSIEDSVISGNTAVQGGGVFSDGSDLTILGSTIIDNIANGDVATVALGGGIADFSGNLEIQDSVIQGNKALGASFFEADAKGGGIYSEGTNSTLVANNVITQNEARGGQSIVDTKGGDGLGGGIYSDGSTWVSFVDNIISNNLAQGADGADDVSEGGHGGRGCGGGIFSDTFAVMMFETSTVAGNRAIGGDGGDTDPNELFAVGGNGGDAEGGGICGIGDTWEIFGTSTLSDNKATGGMGGAAEGLFGTGGDGGTAQGGGIYASFGSTWDDTDPGTVSGIVNVTISGNVATGGDPGTAGTGGDALGGGLHTFLSTVTLLHVTVANNLAIEGAGAGVIGGRGGGIYTAASTVNINSTLVADNLSSLLDPDVSGVFASTGYNLIGTIGSALGFVGTDIINPASVGLGSLDDNGGPTETHALLFGSPAIDAADPVSPLTIDQRFAPRPVDGNGDTVARADIGAYEATPPVIDIEKSTNTFDADTIPGPEILTGNTAVFDYVVTNPGVGPLSGLTVTDNQPVTPSFVSGDTDGDTLLDANETWLYTAGTTVTPGQYSNIGMATGNDATGSFQPPVTPVSDSDPSNHFGADPDISIVKTTNGGDGLDILTGTPITWTYVVTNTGNVDLDTNTGDTVNVSDDQGVIPIFDPGSDVGSDGVLSVGESWTYAAGGTALAGPYANLGRVDISYTDDLLDTRTDFATDGSNYFGADPDISIVKTTNGGNGLDILTGTPITWAYVVTNTGNVDLDTNAGDTVNVSDDQGVIPIFDPGSDVGGDGVLSVGESWTYAAGGTALAGPYANLGRVDISYTDDLLDTRTDFATDGSSYFGADPDISIVKTTNGGDGLDILTGTPITWAYVVTNTGNVDLDTNTGDTVNVSDDQGVIPIFDPGSDVGGDGVLSVGESWTYAAGGTALAGPYANLGRVNISYTDDLLDTRTDFATDGSSYFGADPDIDIEKDTNGNDADTPTGPMIPVGDTAVFTYLVTNPGNVPLNHVSVTDSQLVTVTFVGGDGNNNNLLDTGETWEYTAGTTVTSGQYMNIGTVTANYTDDVGGVRSVTDGDASHHVGVVANPGLSVVDDCFERIFTYEVSGGFLNEAGLRPANADARGAAADSLGKTLWVVDLDKYVYVYQADGTPLGAWRADFAGSQPEGVATDGEDMWIADRSRRRVFFFDNAAGSTSGAFPPDAEFLLHPQNEHPKGITTDGIHLWVVDDAPVRGDGDGAGGLDPDSDEGDDVGPANGGFDRVYKYTVGGMFVGSWLIDGLNTRPTGITLDPAGASEDMWIVDQGSDQVFRYDDAQGLVTGARSADAVFDLAPDNFRPQGIALTRGATAATGPPPPVTSRSPVAAGLAADENDLLGADLTAIGEAGFVTVRQPAATAWHTVKLEHRYDHPVVVLSPASQNGGQPVTLRVRNVQSDSFQFQLDEWDYLDGRHAAETIGYLVVQAGNHVLDDGTVIQAGTLSGVNHRWSRLAFDRPFESTPVLLTQTVTDNAPAAVTTRPQLVTATGFRVRLQEEQGADGRHAKESVTYIAIEQASGTTAGKHFEVGTTGDSVTHRWHSVHFNQSFVSTPVLLAGMQTHDGADPSGLRYRNLRDSGVQLRVAEEQSADPETKHTTEQLGYVLFEAGTIAIRPPAPLVAVGEVGAVTVRQPDSQTWHEVLLNRVYLNPVVIMSPPSPAGGQPLNVRVRHVWGDRFEFQLDEWDYLDGAHVAERIGYLVLEAGRHVLPGGTIVEADVVSPVAKAWKQHSFQEGFDAPPVVLTQVMSDRGVESVVTRHRAVTAAGFQLRLQEEQAADGAHAGEQVGYVALERGSGTTGDLRYEAGSTPRRVQQGWYVQDYGQAYAVPPILLAGLRTCHDADPVTVRYRQQAGSSFQVRLQEEQSADREMKHGSEAVDYAVFEPGVVRASVMRPFGSAFGETGSVTVAPAGATTWHAVELDRSYLDPVVIVSPASNNGGGTPTAHVRNVQAGRFEFQIGDEPSLAPVTAPTAQVVVYVVFEEDLLRSHVDDETAGDFSPAVVDRAILKFLAG